MIAGTQSTAGTHRVPHMHMSGNNVDAKIAAYEITMAGYVRYCATTNREPLPMSATDTLAYLVSTIRTNAELHGETC